MIKKELEAVKIKLDILNGKLTMQSKFMQDVLNNLNEIVISNAPVDEPVAQSYGFCILL